MVLLGSGADVSAADQSGHLHGGGGVLDAEVQEGEENVRTVQVDRGGGHQ